MRIQSRHLALTVLFALMTSAPLVAQETPAEPSGDTAPMARIQRQDRAQVHQPAQGVEARQRFENRVRQEGTAAPQASVRQRTRTSAAGVRTNANQSARARVNASASGVRSVTRQRARIHRTAP